MSGPTVDGYIHDFAREHLDGLEGGEIGAGEEGEEGVVEGAEDEGRVGRGEGLDSGGGRCQYGLGWGRVERGGGGG